jgi:hypothetical protein
MPEHGRAVALDKVLNQMPWPTPADRENSPPISAGKSLVADSAEPFCLHGFGCRISRAFRSRAVP